jgi:hypothetical protein
LTSLTCNFSEACALGSISLEIEDALWSFGKSKVFCGPTDSGSWSVKDRVDFVLQLT